jgi:acyl-CoA thioesterase-2
MTEPLNEVVSLLDLEQIDDNIFRGYSPQTGLRQVYGGQAVAQALVAAQRTAPGERLAHSLHAYFILAGDPRIPIIFEVERVRDGKSFTTRRCAAIQRSNVIFSLEASFQVREEGFDHAEAMPEVPFPDSLSSANALAERFSAFLPKAALEYLKGTQPIDIRVVDPESYLIRREGAPARQYIWFRALRHVPDDPAIHQALLAYLSDMTLLNTALVPHGRLIFDADLQVASLDHALWFHRPFRIDEWMLYAQESASASGGRGLTSGRLYTLDGRLAASVAQEGLIRRRSISK